MAPEHALDVEGRGVEPLGDGRDLRRQHEQEHRIGIDEAADQPGAGDAVDLRAAARHPDGAALARRAAAACRCEPAARRPSSRLRTRLPASVPRCRSCRSQAAVPSLSFCPLWQTTTTHLAAVVRRPIADGAVVAPPRARQQSGIGAIVVVDAHIDDGRRVAADRSGERIGGTVMAVADGIASLSLIGSVDAIFQPQPHGAIADNPVHRSWHHAVGDARGQPSAPSMRRPQSSEVFR